jgi:hypothetical protein
LIPANVFSGLSNTYVGLRPYSKILYKLENLIQRSNTPAYFAPASEREKKVLKH